MMFEEFTMINNILNIMPNAKMAVLVTDKNQWLQMQSDENANINLCNIVTEI